MADNVFGRQTATNLGQIIETIAFCYLSSLFLVEPFIRMLFPHLLFNIPYAYSLIGLLTTISFLSILLRRHRSLSLSWIDICWFVLLLHHLPEYLKNGYLPTSITIATIYILSRLLANKKKMELLFIIGGAVQILLMSLQKLSLLPSPNSYFPITGSFENPGPLGGYLAVFLVACIARLSVTKELKRKKWLFILLSLGGALICSDSRAAWLSVAVAMLYIGMNMHQTPLKRQILAFLMLFVICGSLSLTLYKPASAEGRLTIWKISCSMLPNHPITGNGQHSFRRDYMEYHARYIQKHPDSKETLLLSNNGYAFNEYLRISYEQGIIGLLLVWAILAMHGVSGRNARLFPCLIAFALFSFFSYPSDVFLLLSQAAIISGSLPHPTFVRLPNKRCVRWGLIALSACAFPAIGTQYIQRRTAEKALNHYICHHDYHSLNHLLQHATDLTHSLDFSSRYARTLYLKEEYEEAVSAIRQAISLYPTTDKYLQLGDAYQQLKQYNEAEAAYRHAIHLLPHLIYPYYNLYLLYRQTGREEEAARMAHQMRHLQPKKKNARYWEIMHQLNAIESTFSQKTFQK